MTFTNLKKYVSKKKCLKQPRQLLLGRSDDTKRKKKRGWPYTELKLSGCFMANSLSTSINGEPVCVAWEVLLGILGGGVPPDSPIPDPISDQKM